MILFTGGGGIPACLAAGLQGVVVSQQACRFPGPHPGGKFRGMVSGQGGLQAHTHGGSLGGWHLARGSPGPHPGKSWGGSGSGVSRPTPGGGGLLLGGGCLVPGWGEVETPPRDGCCCGRYASYWNAFLFDLCRHSVYGTLNILTSIWKRRVRFLSVWINLNFIVRMFCL